MTSWQTDESLEAFEASLADETKPEGGELSHPPRETEPRVDVGEGYRLLKQEEKVIENDQYYLFGKWHLTEHVGRFVDEGIYRRVQTDEGAKVAQTVEKALNILNSPHASSETSPPVAPIWYTEDEIHHWLRRHNYSEEISKELSGFYAKHMQLAFEKGYDMGRRKIEKSSTLAGTASQVPAVPGVLPDASSETKNPSNWWIKFCGYESLLKDYNESQRQISEYQKRCAADAVTVSHLNNECAKLKDELDVAEKLLAPRQAILDAIPPCIPHGSCIPHALTWIADAKRFKAERDELRAALDRANASFAAQADENDRTVKRLQKSLAEISGGLASVAEKAEKSPSDLAASPAEKGEGKNERVELQAPDSELLDSTLEAWLTVEKQRGGTWDESSVRAAWKAAWITRGLNDNAIQEDA